MRGRERRRRGRAVQGDGSWRAGKGSPLPEWGVGGPRRTCSLGGGVARRPWERGRRVLRREEVREGRGHCVRSRKD